MGKVFKGIVVSKKMNKTVVVEAERVYAHRLYKKIIRRHKKYKAHNENFDLEVGDRVKIAETRPISKDKHFKVTEKL